MGEKNLTEKYYRYSNPLVPLRENFSLKARAKIHRKFLECLHPTDKTEILDLGTTPDMKLADSNYLEKYYEYPGRITVASIEDCSNLVEAYKLKAFKFNEPGKPLPFSDNEFDILCCSATLEHVGSRKNQEDFVRECLRVAKAVFLTTPNRYFPIEMHTFIPFLHWLPWSWFQKIVLKIVGPFYASTDNLNLLSTKDLYRICENIGAKKARVEYVRTCGFKSNLLLIIEK